MGRVICNLSIASLMICVLNVFGASRASAAESTVVVDDRDRSLVWQSEDSTVDYRLVVSGPSGLIQQEFKAGQLPNFSVFNSEGNALADGEYTWELRSLAYSGDVAPAAGEKPKSSVKWGYFFVRDGFFSLASEKRPVERSREPVQRVFVGEDDAVLIGRMCVGLECEASEVFGDDTLRLKNDEIELRFLDTSMAAPNNDWQITINGSGNKFSLEDLDSGTTPFTVEAGAPSNSYYVDDTGRVGLGTATPGAGLHIVGDTASNADIYLESTDGSAKTWRIRNTPANGRLTFNSIGGNVPFKFSSIAQNNLFRIGIADNGFGGAFDDPNTVSIGSSSAVDGEDSTVLQVFGSIEVNGATVHPDYVFDPSYNLLTIEEHAEFMWGQSHLPGLPKAPEGLVGTVDLVSHQMGMLEELETAHIYIDQLNGIVKEQEKAMKAQNSLLAAQAATLKDFQERLAALEALED